MFRSEPPPEIGRRRLITAAGAGLLATALAACGGSESTAKTTPKAVVAERNDDTKLTWKEARKRLEEGNARFLQGRSAHPDQSSARRKKLNANGQKPKCQFNGKIEGGLFAMPMCKRMESREHSCRCSALSSLICPA